MTILGMMQDKTDPLREVKEEMKRPELERVAKDEGADVSRIL